MLRKQDIINWLRDTTNAREYVLVEDFSQYTRHVCLGGDRVWTLECQYANYPVDLFNGISIQIEYFICRECGKLIINKSTLEF